MRLVAYIENGSYTNTETELCNSALQTMYSKCIVDGVEQGSTGGLVDEWSCPDVSTVIANKLYNCKRKYIARNGTSGLVIST